jgi:hypothetical protein
MTIHEQLRTLLAVMQARGFKDSLVSITEYENSRLWFVAGTRHERRWRGSGRTFEEAMADLADENGVRYAAV